MLDILQSVPVLGFLSVTVTAFINLFPGSELGLGCASVFAIFTSMAWNMTFAFYHSLVSQPRDLDEASRILRLTRWQRFWRLDVPSGMIPLVWNGMMSFGGAWFFLAASEAISVLNHHYALPGLGSYAAAAIAQGNLGEVGYAIVAQLVLVLGVNFLFWRPVTAWAERFRVEESESAEKPRSLVLDVLRRSEVPELLGRPLKPVGRLLDRVTRPFGLAEHPLAVSRTRERTGDVFFAGVIAVLATKSWPRRVVGVVVALAGVGLIWRSLTGLRALSVSRARALVQDKHPGIQLGSAVPQVSVHSGWAVLSCVCGVVVLLAGVLVASRGHRWGGMSAKYDAPVDDGTAADRQDSAEDAERARLRADASLWSALDRGDDPTNHNG